MKKLLLTLAVLCGTVSAWAQVYQKVPHANWKVSAPNEAATSGNEGGVAHLVDENASTFYHSDWAGTYTDGTQGKYKGQDGLQCFMVEMPETYSFDRISYAGRSDNGNNWATKVRIYAYEVLPAVLDGVVLKDLTFAQKEDLLKKDGQLGTPIFDNNEEGVWAGDRNVKTVDFATAQKAKYILFVADATTYSNGYFTCSDFNLWQKLDGIESGVYNFKITNARSGDCYIDVTKGKDDTSGPTIVASSEPANVYLTLVNGYWHISASSSSAYLGVNQWCATPNAGTPTNWTVEDAGDGTWYLLQSTYFNANRRYLGGDIVNNAEINGLYTDATKEKAVKIKLEAATTIPCTVVYRFLFNGEEKETYRQTTENCIVGSSYPAVTSEFPFGIVASAPAGDIQLSEVVDGVVTKEIQLTTNLPFVAASEPGSITSWYYMKMHSNNRKYIQNINDEYLEWADVEMDLTSIDSYTWAFVGNPFDGFKMVNKASGLNKAVLSTGSGNPSMTAYADATAFVYSKTAENVSGGFCMKYPSGGQYLNAQGGKVAHWGAADAGSTFMIERTLPVQLTINDANPFYYELKSGRDGDFWYTYNSSDGKIYLGGHSPGLDAQLWFFKGLYQDGKLCVQLYPKEDPTKAMSYENTNSGAGKIVAQVPGTEGWKNTWKFVYTNGAAPYGLRTPGDENYLSNFGGTTEWMGMWNASPADDKGTAIYIYQTIDNIITDMAGNTYESTSFAQVGQLPEPAAFTGVAGYTLSNKCWIDNKFTADIDFGFPVSKVGGQTYATMISSFSGSNFKWYANGTGVNAQKAVLPTSANVVNYLWAIYPSFTEGSFSFTIKNIGAGKYINSTSADNSHDAGVVTLADEGSALTYESGAQFKLSTGKYLSQNSSTANNVQIIGTWGSHGGTKNSFPASVVSVAIGEAGYSTVYLPFAVTLPAEVEAYAVESVGGSYATLSDAKTTIPANTGAILKATASTYTLNAGEAEEWSDNLLEGSSVNTYVEGPAYVLSKVGDDVGMYKALLNKNEAGESGTTHFLNNAGKAYLPATAGGEARFLVFNFGTETGIDELKGENGNVKAEIYDLSGRRVQNAQKGLYIVNGKKVVR